MVELVPVDGRARLGGHRRKHVGPEQSRLPSDCCTPIVPYDDGLFFAKCSDKAHHVPDKLHDVVRINIGWQFGLAIAPHVGCNDMKSCRCQCWQLMSP